MQARGGGRQSHLPLKVPRQIAGSQRQLLSGHGTRGTLRLQRCCQSAESGVHACMLSPWACSAHACLPSPDLAFACRGRGGVGSRAEEPGPFLPAEEGIDLCAQLYVALRFWCCTAQAMLHPALTRPDLQTGLQCTMYFDGTACWLITESCRICHGSPTSTCGPSKACLAA